MGIAEDIRDIVKQQNVYESRLMSEIEETKGQALPGIENPTLEMIERVLRINPYALRYIREQTPENCLIALHRAPLALQFVHEQSEELCLIAVKKNGLALQFVKDQTETICLAAVGNNGQALKFVKEQTDLMCLTAVLSDGLALEYVENQTELICLAAVIQNPKAIQFVEDKFIDPYLTPSCMVPLAAVVQDGQTIGFMKNRFADFIFQIALINDARAVEYRRRYSDAFTDEAEEDCSSPEVIFQDYMEGTASSDIFSLAAVMRNGLLLQYIAEDKQTETQCMAAVIQNPDAIKYVHHQTEAVCLAAVLGGGNALYYIHDKTEPLCLAAVTKNPDALRFIENPTEAVKLAAIKRDGLAIQYVPEQSEELCMAAAKSNPYFALLYLEHQTEDVLKTAIRIGFDEFDGLDGPIFSKISLNRRTEGVFLENVKANPYIFEFIPEEHRTDAVCMAAVERWGGALRNVDNQTEALCLAAVRQNWEALRWVKRQTEDLCREAVQQNPRALELVNPTFAPLVMGDARASLQKWQNMTDCLGYKSPEPPSEASPRLKP